jgi:hypothetical protein
VVGFAIDSTAFMSESKFPLFLRSAEKELFDICIVLMFALYVYFDVVS